VRLNLLQPVGNVAKRRLFCAVVHQDDAHGPLIVRLGNCAEAFLSCRVPNLQLDALVLHVNRLYLEIDACHRVPQLANQCLLPTQVLPIRTLYP